MKLEYDTWYWITHPHEGDVWWPVYVNSNFEYQINEEWRDVLELKNFIVEKAVMPIREEP